MTANGNTGWLRPRVAIPVLLAALVAVLLLSPQTNTTFDRVGPLTTTSTTPAGAQGLYEVAHRLGWPVSRSHTRFAGRLDSSRVYLVLAPPMPLTAVEVHALLDAVRRGAGLVTVVEAGSELNDSLHVRASNAGGTMVPIAVAPEAPACPADMGASQISWLDGLVHLFWLVPGRAWDADTSVFVTVKTDPDSAKARRIKPAALGVPLGAGRVVELADADLLRNDVIRVCGWGLGPQAVRMLEYASGGPGARRPLVFDEFHFDQVARADWTQATEQFLADTSWGRAMLQVVIAGLVLLAAAAWRPVAPAARARIERRSALEHVDALARAYAKVGATRTAVHRLVRGLRRRHARPAAGDAAYLAAVTQRHPEARAYVERILDGEQRQLTPAELLAAGDAIDHLDRILGP